MGWLRLAPSLLVSEVLEWQHLELGRWRAMAEFVHAKSIGWPHCHVPKNSFGFGNGNLMRLLVSSRGVQGFQTKESLPGAYHVSLK